MAYRRDDIERVRAATDLVELVGEVTKVKRSGRSTMAICPFHQEKTPSLSIDGGRGLYHCFGCGKSGDVFGWVEETQSLDFTEAVELLARRAGVTLQVDPGEARRRDRREALVDAVAKAVEFFENRLRTAPDAASARSYLRGRGYGAETVAAFHLGFSPPDWSELVDHLKNLGIKEQALLGAGLAVRSSRGRLVDRFRGRIMFPIYDLRGDPVGFGARQLDGDPPKYLNSPETPLYHKARLLYGLNWAKSEIVRSGEAVVVEGYTDVIGMHEAGMPVSVATCGTALGEDHLRLLARFTERVVLAFDADEAGVGASLRGFEHHAGLEMDVRVAFLPEGRDPAELAATDAEMLRKVIGGSAPLLQVRLERELERFELGEAEARARAVRAAAALVARHPDQVVRHEYAVFLARRTGVELDVVVDAVARAVRAAGGRQPEPPPAPARRLTGEEKEEREMLRMLLANDPGVRDVELEASLFTALDHREAYDLVAPAVLALAPGEAPDLGALLGDDETPLGEMLRGLAFDQRPFGDATELVEKIQGAALDRRIHDLRRRLDTIDRGAEPEEYSDIFHELIGLERSRHRGAG